MSYEVAPGILFWRRAELGLPAPKQAIEQATKTEFIVHHSGGTELGRSDNADWWRTICDFHMSHNGWIAVGYNFGVANDPHDPDVAHVLEGRGWHGVGAHTVNHNAQGLGVCYLRNGAATPAIKRAIRFLYDSANQILGRPLKAFGHRDLYKTECPGDLLDWVHYGMPVGPMPTLRKEPKVLNDPVVAVLSTLSGDGYWLVAADGGVFAYGDAEFYGSMGGKGLAAPVTGATLHPSGEGYWLTAADGGVFAFGAAQFHGAPTGDTD